MGNNVIQFCAYQNQSTLHYSIVLTWKYKEQSYTTTTNYRLPDEIKPFPTETFHQQLAECLIHVCRKILFTHELNIENIKMNEFSVQFMDDDITFFAKDLLPQIKETAAFQSFLHSIS